MPSTSVINEPIILEAFIRKSEVAKNGTEDKRITSLAEDANRSAPKFNKETLQQKICNHRIDLLRRTLVRRI